VSDEIVRERRVRFERSLDRLRDEVEGQLGWAPRWGRWALPIAASAAALVAGWALRRNLPKLLRR
jgi:hypothetical protein